MSFEVPAIAGRIGFDESPAIASFKKVEKVARDFKKNVEGTFQETGQAGGKAFFKGLSSEYGKKTAFAQALKLAMGGGAIGGLAMGARVFEDFTGSLKNLAVELQDQDMKWRDVMGEFVRTLPVLGPMVKGFDNLREAISGEGAALEKEVAAAKAFNDAADRRIVAIKEGKKQAQEWAEIVSNLRNEFELLRAPGNARVEIKERQERQQGIDDMQKKFLVGGGYLTDDGGTGKYTEASRKLTEAMKLRDKMRTEQLQAEAALSQKEKAFGGASSFGMGTEARSTELSDLRNNVDQARQKFEDAQAAVLSLRTELDGMGVQAKKAFEGFDEATDQLFKNEAAAAEQRRIASEVAQAQLQVNIDNFLYVGRLKGRWQEIKTLVTDAASKTSEFFKDSRERGKALHESLRTPAEAFAADLRNYQQLFNTLNLNKTDFARGILKSQRDYEQAVGPRSFGVRSEASTTFDRVNTEAPVLEKVPPLLQKLLDETIRGNGLTSDLKKAQSSPNDVILNY